MDSANQDMRYLWLVTVNFHESFTDFRVQVLDDNAFRVGIPANGWSRLSKMANGIQDLGRHNFLTKSVRPPDPDIPDGPMRGEFSVDLCYDSARNAYWLYHSLYEFKSPDCDRLMASRLYPILNDYITHTDVSTRGTIFGCANP